MKITLWFAGALVLMVALTYGVLLSVSHQVIQKTVRDGLIETVENNVDEIEFYETLDEMNLGRRCRSVYGLEGRISGSR